MVRLADIGAKRGAGMEYSDAMQKALDFRKERGWEQFHNAKDLAVSINLEASELLELFQWSGSNTEIDDATTKENAEEELADVIIYCIYLADKLGVNIPDAVARKIDKNASKYPVAKAKGSSRKYTEL